MPPIRSLAFALILAASPALALTTERVEVTCPYDGTPFEATLVTSETTFGVALDLKPQGATLAPYPLAECPTNGFVFFPGEMPEAADLERIRPYVFSPAFAALRRESPYFRDAALAEQLGAPHADITYRLLMATWEVDATPDLYRRYAETVIARLDVDIAAAEGEEREFWLMLKGELLRRTGAFGPAEAHFTSIIAELALDSPLRPIVAFQLSLIAAADAEPHALDEIETPE